MEKNYEKWTEEKIKDFYERQLEVIKNLGCSHKAIEFFEDKEQQKNVISKVLETEFFEGNIPFLLVVTESYLNYGIASAIRNKPKDHCHAPHPEGIFDIVSVPERGFYVAYDIEDAKKTIGKSPEVAEKLVEKENRSCLTIMEGLFLSFYTEVLEKRSLYCVGSRYSAINETKNGIPGIHLDTDNIHPYINYSFSFESNYHWGSPSCGGRE
jgi:hypothetical protein